MAVEFVFGHHTAVHFMHREELWNHSWCVTVS